VANPPVLGKKRGAPTDPFSSSDRSALSVSGHNLFEFYRSNMGSSCSDVFIRANFWNTYDMYNNIITSSE
jgi:hypothetical protein